MLKVAYDTKHEYYKVAGNEYYLYIGKRVNPLQIDDNGMFRPIQCEFDISKKTYKKYDTLKKNIYGLLYKGFRYRFIETNKYEDVTRIERLMEKGKPNRIAKIHYDECWGAMTIFKDYCLYYDYLKHYLAPPLIFWVEDWQGNMYTRGDFGINNIECCRDWINK